MLFYRSFLPVAGRNDLCLIFLNHPIIAGQIRIQNIKIKLNYRKLKNLLDTLYLKYRKKYSSKDTVWNLHKFSDKKDIEIIGLITSCYAYGQVDLINKFIDKLLNQIGKKPYEFTINFSKRKDKKYLECLGYRFHKDYDLINLFNAIHKAIIHHGSIQKLFTSFYSSTHENILPALSGFSSSLTKNVKSKGKSIKSYFEYLIPNPSHGSTCKRLMLYLRWMVRKDEIDFGIWENVPASKLIMPIDIHISRVARKLNLVKRKSVDLKFALELTEKLKQFDPNDPVKYDFSLCHYEMEKKILPP